MPGRIELQHELHPADHGEMQMRCLDRSQTGPCTQAEYPTFFSSMGVTELAAGMDSTPLPASHELRLELDPDTDISSPPRSGVGDGASHQRLNSAVTAVAQFGREDPPATPLTEQPQGQPQSAMPHASAATWPDTIPVAPAAPSEAPAPSEAKPGVTGAWQTPLSTLRALLAARMHGRRSAADTAQSQQAVAPPIHSLSAAAPMATVGQPRDDVQTTDKLVSTADEMVAPPVKLQAHQGVAEPAAPADGSVSEMESVLDICHHCDTGEDRPHKRRRTAREVVCHFFGLQDSDFVEAAA